MDVEFLRSEVPLAIEQSLEGLARVASIVGAMKDFSHPGSSRKEPADLNRSIASTIEVCRARWKYVAELTTDFASDLPAIPCLIAELNQVILNLIVNAADAIGEHGVGDGASKGRIAVSTRLISHDGAPFVEIRVQDNGPGIPETAQRRIFEPFFTTKPVGKGTGQGLAISRNVIIQKHAGELFFNTKEGVGTTFVVRLPVTDTKNSNAEAA
jgi:signal transduction histidine kinase